MATPLRVLCVHGVGNQEANLAWQPMWEDAIFAGLRTWNQSVEVETDFLQYDGHFKDAGFDVWDVVEGAAGLGASAIVHSIGDAIGGLFGRRGMSGAGEPAARGGLDDSIRWTAGMVLQWASDEKLRKRLQATLLAKLKAFKPDLIAAHSLGSLLTYDTLLRNPAEAARKIVVTFGSQIGHPGVRSTYAGRIEPLASAGHWYHLFNDNDRVLTKRLKIHSDNFTQIETLFDVPHDALDHAAERYLGHQATLEQVWRPIASAMSATPRGVRGMGAAIAAQNTQTTVARQRVRQRRKIAQRALLVGINDYPNPEDRLEGCVNDCFRMSEVLQELGFDPENIRLVLNDRATSGAVLDRLDWLLEDPADGDLRVLYYSGHGARIPDYGPDERVDHKDECLCTYDFDWDPDHCITDDRFYEYYSQLPYGTNFLAILDCCHSGGMTRDGGPRIRGLSPPDDIRHRGMMWDSEKQMWKERALALADRRLTANVGAAGGKRSKAKLSDEPTDEVKYLGASGNTKKLGTAVALWSEKKEYERVRDELEHKGPYTPVLIQACAENQYSYEYRHGVTSYGAFTYAASTILREKRKAGVPITINGLVEQTGQRLKELKYQQSPLAVGPGSKLDTALFGREEKKGPTKAKRRAKVKR